MSLLLTFGLCITAVVVTAIVAIRQLLKRKSNELTLRIEDVTPYYVLQECKEEKQRQDNEFFFGNIETDLEYSFHGQFVTFREEKQFTEYYTELFHEVRDYLIRFETFHVEPSEIVAQFVSDFENIHLLVKSHNEQFIQKALDKHKSFFDHCLKYPLDKQQRRSIVSEEDNCLVVSSAGSGKTSAIVGKVKTQKDVRRCGCANSRKSRRGII